MWPATGVESPIEEVLPQISFYTERLHVIAYALQRALRSLGERGFAPLAERWTTLKYITLGPSRIGDLFAAALVLVHFEYGQTT